MNFRAESVLILCALLFAFHCEAINVWDGDSEAPAELLGVNFKKQFEEISEFLTEKVHTDKIEINMKKANERYNQLLSTNFLSHHLNPNKRRMIEALELFLSLGALESKGKCNMESYRILLQNDLSADSVAHQSLYDSELESLNRVQRIIHDASRRHAETCYSRYPDLFKEVYYKMDQEMLQKVSLLLDEYITSQKAEGRESNSEKIYNRFVFQPEAMGLWNFAKSIYDKTEDFPKHSPSSNKFLSLLDKDRIHKKRAKQLYKDRVLEPCDYYVRQLKDVFVPARYDAVFHREDDGDEYYMSWARFRLCNSLLHLDRRQLIKQINTIHKETIKSKEEEEKIDQVV